MNGFLSFSNMLVKDATFGNHPRTCFLPRDVQGTKNYFASEVGLRLQEMDEAIQQEWWQRWLKRYWKNRLQGSAGWQVESGEVAHMLNWLPHLSTVFPEAVDLAVQMPQIPSQELLDNSGTQ